MPEALQAAWRVLSALWTLIGIWPAWALLIRRCHDLGWSGWWTLLPILTPFIGLMNRDVGGNIVLPLAVFPTLAMLVALLFLPGNRGVNAYGPSPI